MNQLLARLLGTPGARRRPLAADTRRILVVRLNKRLGNVLFLTPMLRSLAASLPEARIDIVIQSPAQVDLLQSLPGVGRVWVQKNRVFGLFGLLRAIRRERYDLAIDPTGNSASNRIGMALSGARQRLGFANADQWLPLTHAAGRSISRHQALQAVELLTGGISDPPIERFDTLAVFPEACDRQAAETLWHDTLGVMAPRTPVIGFFSRATGDKQLARPWWEAFLAAVSQAGPNAVLVEILPGPDADPIDPARPHVAIASLTQLAAFMARCDQFVAADSGPMHLAAAAGVPVVGLFQATAPSHYAPLGQACISLEGERLTPSHTARVVVDRLATGTD
ncbi:glycosyltransferase family 9 protein [Salinisphaera sp. Q1T1-3]|uniref:glycosyltransferase family 9 protein n=1 Tax=Salinisphaera sp. Q1T1-3 TaxID=2321229 RepID=UPI000E7435A7|nr:glycosyltransferase family 9 protein [Salinisphaera sp. Q1T1-3]RJS92859.1 lipopolysaccharide heptosyltransferase family protein [Salinisphaera sp. Q1T1-3]